jgi:hypothetical protein
MSKNQKAPQTAADDFDAAVADVLAGANDGTISAPVPGETEEPVAETTSEEVLIGVDPAGPSGDETVETTFEGGEIIAQRRIPRNPDRCVNARIVYPKRRIYCVVEVGPCVTDDEFRVNGQVPEGEEDTLSAFASVAALYLAQEAQRRDIEVIRLENVEAAAETAKALTEAGFHVITYPA